MRVHGDLDLPAEDLKLYSDAWNRAFEEGAVVGHDPAEQPQAPAAG